VVSGLDYDGVESFAALVGGGVSGSVSTGNNRWALRAAHIPVYCASYLSQLKVFPYQLV
jgi:hypothetical protein